MFSPEELAEMAAADEEIEASFALTVEDYKLSDMLDRAARFLRKDTQSQERSAWQKAYYETHKEELNAWQKAYRAAHREELNAKRKAYRAAKKEHTKEINRNQQRGARKEDRK